MTRVLLLSSNLCHAIILICWQFILVYNMFTVVYVLLQMLSWVSRWAYTFHVYGFKTQKNAPFDWPINRTMLTNRSKQSVRISMYRYSSLFFVNQTQTVLFFLHLIWMKPMIKAYNKLRWKATSWSNLEHLSQT